VIENFKMEDDGTAKSFGNGHFRVDVEADTSNATGDEIKFFVFKFAFRGE
jgi:hypothetical protein